MNLLSAARMKEWMGGELPALDIMVVQIDGLQAPARTDGRVIAFTPTRRGRPQPLLLHLAHRQRAYELRRARVQPEANVPSLLLGRDIDVMRTRAGIERVVVDVLRKHGILPPAPKRPPRLRIVETKD